MRCHHLLCVLTFCLPAINAGCRAADERPASVPPPTPQTVSVTPFDPSARPYELAGPLVPADVTMISAWDIPRNPLEDLALDDSPRAEEIRRGFRLFMNTPVEAPHLAPGRMACANCHLNAGQRERALPLVGSAGMFPEYNRRAGRDFTLEDRIVGCFMRSENSPGVGARHEGRQVASDDPSADAPEVLALAAYVRWLSEGYGPGQAPPWRGQNRIAPDKLMALDQLDREKGETLFREHCINCHGEDGQGVQIGDKRAGPLWGPDSWNDGAGAARVYTLAGIIRYMMPYLDPGALTDEEAQQIAAFITSKPRPGYPFKDQDYAGAPPVDAVYYRPRAGATPLPTAR